MKNLLNEITILRSINSPYICEYYGSYIKGQNLWITMELFEVGSIHKLIKQLGSLKEEHISCIISQVLKAVDALHNAKIVHRDIKADNILMNKKGEAKLGDFGVSRTTATTSGKKMTATGSPYWIAPEVMTSEDYNNRVDVWSLGITAIELAEKVPPYYNYLPFRAMFLIGDLKKPAPTLSQPEKWSKEFKDFIGRCLVKDPTKRASVEELLKHPFVACAGGPTDLVELVQEFQEQRQATKIRQTLERQNSDSVPDIDPDSPRTNSMIQEMSTPSLHTRSSSSSGEELEPIPESPTRPRIMSNAAIALRSAVQLEHKELRNRSGSGAQVEDDNSMWKISDLVNLMKDPEKGISIKDRSIRLKRFPNCFVASEAIDWMMQLEEMKLLNREEAIFIGRELQRRGVIEHVSGNQPFADKKNLLFWFTDGIPKEKQKVFVMNMKKIWNVPTNPRPACEVIHSLLTQIHGLYLKYYADKDPSNQESLSRIRKDPGYAVFVDATGELQQTDISGLSQTERKMFWINTYNTLHLHTYIHLKFPTSTLQKYAMTARTCYQIGQFGRFSMQDIEFNCLRSNMFKPAPSHKKLKSRMDINLLQILQIDCDPRLNFVLTTMSKSGPEVFVFSTSNLENELNSVMLRYLEKHVELKQDGKKKVLFLPKLFEWYSRDFAKTEKEIPNWIVNQCSKLLSDTEHFLLKIENPNQIKYKEFSYDYCFH
eukprot:TRINITY_DN3259_c0_g1_i3.p1 TRINITY_DN3259_c0_g1~~TRINITY_DN3259_c0_g1_i3.p1  ORF type:complete len:806 (-),score=206.07 TRINITY_DN3259_c0_g1_i3:15-2150(-)